MVWEKLCLPKYFLRNRQFKYALYNLVWHIPPQRCGCIIQEIGFFSNSPVRQQPLSHHSLHLFVRAVADWKENIVGIVWYVCRRECIVSMRSYTYQTFQNIRASITSIFGNSCSVFKFLSSTTAGKAYLLGRMIIIRYQNSSPPSDFEEPHGMCPTRYLVTCLKTR